MIIRCIQRFGNFVPGDELEVPDEAVFDTTFFEATPTKGNTPKGGAE